MSEEVNRELATEVVSINRELFAARVGSPCRVSQYSDLTGRTSCKSVNNPRDPDQGIVSLVNSGRVDDFPIRLQALNTRISLQIEETEDAQSVEFLENLRNTVGTAIDSLPTDQT